MLKKQKEEEERLLREEEEKERLIEERIRIKEEKVIQLITHYFVINLSSSYL